MQTFIIIPDTSPDHANIIYLRGVRGVRLCLESAAITNLSTTQIPECIHVDDELRACNHVVDMCKLTSGVRQDVDERAEKVSVRAKAFVLDYVHIAPNKAPLLETVIVAIQNAAQ